MVLFELVCSLDSDKKKRRNVGLRVCHVPLGSQLLKQQEPEGGIWRETVDLTDRIELFSNEFSEKNGK